VIDTKGYRSNVGIIIFNSAGQLLWARRIGETAWQFPQGGIRHDETPEQALFRELNEEVGLTNEDVELVARTRDWLHYDLPAHMRREHQSGQLFVGQKQLWFLLRLLSNEKQVCLDSSDAPEFDFWRWVSPELTLDEIIGFKREVYKQALDELIPVMDSKISQVVRTLEKDF